MQSTGMKGKRVVITGATSGIGEACARALARAGADLTFVARSREKAEALAGVLRAEGAGRVGYELGDLAELTEARRVADAIHADPTPIDVLVNNAGIMHTRREVTSDGFERTFALNHLAYFVVTTRLLDHVRRAPNGRIISTASDAHLMVKDMFWDDLQLARAWPRRGWTAYCQSKLANVMMTLALARRLEGSNARANAVHPGFVRTGLGRDNGAFARIAVPIISLFGARSPTKGADTLVWLASSPEAASVTGEYLYDRRPHRTSRAARDVEKQERLWALTTELVARAS